MYTSSNDNFSSFGYFREYIKDKPLLTQIEEQELAIKIKEGDETAKKKMFDSNIRLVLKIALQIKTKTNYSLDDLVQHGFIGLMRAIEKFDPTLGIKFSTYATKWISSKMYVGCEHESRNIAMTKQNIFLINKYKKAEQLLTQKLFRDPTIEEIAKEIGVSAKETIMLNNYLYDTRSIYEENDEDREFSLENYSVTPDRELETEFLKQEKIEWIKKLFSLAKLTDNEKKVIEGRYGFHNGEIETLEGLGKELGVTAECVRQTVTRALRKLRIASLKNNYTSLQDDEISATRNLQQYQSDYYNETERKSRNNRKNGKNTNGEYKERPKLKTFYDYFELYPKEVIDAAILLLDDKDLNLIKTKYGEDLMSPPKTGQISRNIHNAFYSKFKTKFLTILNSMMDNQKSIGKGCL